MEEKCVQKCIRKREKRFSVPRSYDLYFLLLVNSTALYWDFGMVSTVPFAQNNLDDNCKNCVTNVAEKLHITLANISYMQIINLTCDYDATESNKRPEK